MLAEEVQDYMRCLGFRKLDDLIGRADRTFNEGAGVKKEMEQNHGVDKCIDMRLIEKAKTALEI
ncbi:hypothetical protein PInf_019992 [Phytophthora infestans]|nr:hypothetical protein PInf_019992 [Phytophthora infestans]